MAGHEPLKDAAEAAASENVKLELGHDAEVARDDESPSKLATYKDAAPAGDGVAASAAGKKERPNVSRSTWVHLCLLSAAWACAFSGLTASVASLSVASKQVLHEDALSTLPTALVLFMTAVANIFIAWEVQFLGGRKWANAIGASIGIVSSGLLALALVRKSFLGVCLAATLMGVANAHGQLYRFAAVEFVPPEYQSTAIAIVLSGGVVGAVVGPEYSKRTKSAIPEHQFVGCFLASMGIYALNLVLILIIRFPSGGFVKPAKSASGAAAPPTPSSSSEEGSTAGERAETEEPAGASLPPPERPPSLDGDAAEASPGERMRAEMLLSEAEETARAKAEAEREGRAGETASGDPPSTSAAAAITPAAPLQRSLRQLLGPVEVHSAIAISAISYGTMCLLMLPVPIAMVDGGFSFADSALVVQMHMLSMYIPSFLSGTLVARLGAAAVQVLGAVILVVGTIIFLDGEAMAHYSVGEVLNGLGWNLLFSGATNTLATASAARAFTPAERTRAQAANDLCVFVLAGVGSFTSSIVLKRAGWAVIQYASQAACGLILVILARAWLWEMREAAAKAGEAAAALVAAESATSAAAGCPAASDERGRAAEEEA